MTDTNNAAAPDFKSWKHENLVRFAEEVWADNKVVRAERDTYRDAWRQLLKELGEVDGKTVR
jgi:hypothetical protein